MSTTTALPVERGRALNGQFKALAITLAAVCATGWLMMTSASSGVAALQEGDSWYFSRRQLAMLLLGAGIAWLASRLRVRAMRKLTPLFFLLTIGLLVAVLVIGREVGGQRNWIPLAAGFNLQPSELAKLALVLVSASWIRFARKHGLVTGAVFAGLLVIDAVIIGLVFAEGDFGNPVILAAIGAVILLVAGVPIRWFVWTGSAGVVAFAGVLFAGGSYRFDRIAAWLNPEAYARSDGWQLLNGMYALADGGWFGRGLGQSSEKWGSLPAPHTDFILPIIGQEFGVIGTGIVIAMLLTLIGVAYHIAEHSYDYYDRLTAFGIGTWLAAQTAVNLGGVTQLFPITGVPLPFISYGGSSTLVLMAAMGVLLGIARHNSNHAPNGV